MIAAPFATSILCDQGADVIKVELNNGRGDRMRFLGDHRNGMGAVFHSVNRGKRSIAVDTKDPRGADILRRLVDTADVFVQNFRPGAVERMGVGVAEVRARRPELIYVSVSGFGRDGPSASEMVYDFVVQGMTGLAALEGMGEPPAPDEGPDDAGAAARPRLTRSLTVDKATALTVSQAVTAALFHRERTGEGQHVELNMLEAGLQFVWPDAMWNHTLLGDGIRHNPHMALNYDVHATKDGYVTVNLATNSTWERLARAIDPTMIDDPRFATYADRQDNSAALSERVDAVLATRTTAEALEHFRREDVPAGPVHSLDDVHEDPQIVHNRSLAERESRTIGPLRDPRPAARFGAEQPEPGGDAPALGEHTDEILAELGIDADARAGLRADRVVG